MRAGYHNGRDSTKRQYLQVQLLHQGWQDINFKVDRLASGKAYPTGQQLWQVGYNRFITPIQTYRIDDLGASDEELVDLQLADLLTGDCLCPSLREDAQVALLGEWCMAGALMQPHQGVRPIGSTGGPDSQFPYHFLHGGDPSLARVHPYG